MKKLLILGLIGAVAVVAIAKQTSAWSYATTFARQVERETKDRVPTKFELERIRNEIAALDGDISQMVRPVAEYKVAIEKMRKDIDKSQAKIEERKKDLLAVVKDLEPNPKFLTYAGTKYPAERVRTQLQRDTQSLKMMEKHVKTQQQVLEAKEASLKATQEQLVKVLGKKREYEIRLAQLEVEEETLKLASIGTDIKIDGTRAAQIENALNDVDNRIKVQITQIELKNGDLASIPFNERQSATLDLPSIRNYLEGQPPAEKTASNK